MGDNGNPLVAISIAYRPGNGNPKVAILVYGRKRRIGFLLSAPLNGMAG
jgi:hypothetical protein